MMRQAQRMFDDGVDDQGGLDVVGKAGDDVGGRIFLFR